MSFAGVNVQSKCTMLCQVQTETIVINVITIILVM